MTEKLGMSNDPNIFNLFFYNLAKEDAQKWENEIKEIKQINERKEIHSLLKKVSIRPVSIQNYL